MTQNEKVRELVGWYLSETKLMQVATCEGNKPWVATVWFVSDDKMNLYFVSRRFRRHSMEMEKNPNVAGAVVKPHNGGSGDKVVGLQFEGTGRVCNASEFKVADELYRIKYPGAARVPPATRGPDNQVATFYIIKPKLFVLFDEVNFPKEPRQELPIGR